MGREHSRSLAYDIIAYHEFEQVRVFNKRASSTCSINRYLQHHQDYAVTTAQPHTTPTMSFQSYSTFQSSSYSSSSDSSGNRYEERTSSNPSGTTIHRTTQEAGQPATQETTRIPAGGAAAQQVEGMKSDRRIEDVTDADKLYEENIEDEYAKREGGA